MEKKFGKRAQLSLEYLLLLLVFFSVLLLLLPLAERSYSLALFGFDSRQAASFSLEFAETASQLSLLENGSVLQLTAIPLHEWIITANGNSLTVSFFSDSLGKEKTIEAKIPLQLFFEKSFSEKTVFFLKKENGKLSVNSEP